MSYGNTKLYLYKDVVDLVIGSDGLYVDNRPMNNKRLTAHKGLSNELCFSIRDKDRKLQNVNSEIIRGTLFRPATGERIFTRILEHTGSTGQVKLNIAEGDLTNLDEGLYQLYISRETSESVEYPVYADQNNNLVFGIEIKDQTKKTPVDTQTANVSQFMQVTNTNNGDDSNVFVTSAFKGNQARNFSSILHSIAIHPNLYDGNIDIQASCIENTPDTANNSNDWFSVSGNIQVTHKFLTTGDIIITDSNIQTSTGSVASFNLDFITITDNEVSNANIIAIGGNKSNIDISSATTLANVVTLINEAGNTNANVTASVVSNEDTLSNTKTYQLRIAGMDYTLEGNSIANLGITAGNYKKPASNIIHRTFQVNANWVRVLSEASAGNISLVQLRN